MTNDNDYDDFEDLGTSENGSDVQSPPRIAAFSGCTEVCLMTIAFVLGIVLIIAVNWYSLP